MVFPTYYNQAFATYQFLTGQIPLNQNVKLFTHLARPFLLHTRFIEIDSNRTSDYTERLSFNKRLWITHIYVNKNVRKITL